MSPWRERMISTLISGQLGGPGWSMNGELRDEEYVNMTNVTHDVKTTTFETSPKIAAYA